MTDEWFIDFTELGEKPRVWQGTFAPVDLERVDEAVAADEGEIRYRVSASVDPQRRQVVSCIIEGFVFLECQASMEVFRHPLKIEDRLVVVDDESHLPPIQEEGEEEDFVVADAPLDVRTLVEDAVILALPMVPRKPGMENAPLKREAAPSPEESPFAALQGLKKTPKP